MQYNIRLDSDTREKVVAKRAVTGIPTSEVVDQGLRQYLIVPPDSVRDRVRHNDQMTISQIDSDLVEQLRDANINVAQAIRQILQEWVKEGEGNV